MEYAAHEARLNQPARDGTPERVHLEALAKSGRNPRALALLQGPPLPDTLAYLWNWAVELHGRSGRTIHLSGEVSVNPLTYTTIADWARLTRRNPGPLEVEALLRLDAVLLNPPKAAS